MEGGGSYLVRALNRQGRGRASAEESHRGRRPSFRCAQRLHSAASSQPVLRLTFLAARAVYRRKDALLPPSLPPSAALLEPCFARASPTNCCSRNLTKEPLPRFTYKQGETMRGEAKHPPFAYPREPRGRRQ